MNTTFKNPIVTALILFVFAGLSLAYVVSHTTPSFVSVIPDFPAGNTQTAAISGANSGLVAHYTFDDGTANDSSGNGNNGTLVNGPTAMTGKVGGALSFDGVDDRISTPVQLPVSGAFTVSMWVKKGTLSTSHMLFTQDHDGAHDLALFYSVSFNGFAYENENNTTDTMTGWTYTLDNNWHHITLVEPYTGDVDGASLYIDGVLITSKWGGQNTSPAKSNLHIGGRIGGESEWNGLLDDVRVYSRTISAGEVTELYTYTGTLVEGGTPLPPEGPAPEDDVTPSAPLVETVVTGGNIYITQTVVGNGSASSCTNAQSAVWFNNSANWGTGTSQIGPGDVVHLCGTVSTALIFRGSGSAGNPITLVFEPGAKMSAPTWPTPAAIYVPSRSYIVIDGGTNGVIEATASGTNFPLAAVTQRAIRSEGGTNLEIKNLIIRNFYLRTPLSGDPADQGFGMSLAGTSNLSVHDNFLTEMRTGIVASGSASNISIYSNTLTRISNGMFISAGGSASSVLNGLKLYDNTILDGYVWDGILTNGHWFHNDGIQISAPIPGSYTDNVEVYGNVIGGDMGTHITAHIYMEDDIRNTKVYNNVLYTIGTSWPVNGFIVTGTPSWVYGNTIVASAGGTGVQARGPQSKVIGNLMIGISYGISTVDDSRLGVSDYNLYYFWKDREMGSRPYIWKYDKWRAELGYDQHSVEITSPQVASVFIDKVNSDFRLKAGSPAIDAIQSVDVATLLRGISLVNASGNPVDFIGTPRPQGSAWDIGAYEYYSGQPTTPPVVLPPLVTPPTPTPVNGTCGTTLNICSSGTLNNIPDSTTNYLWQCLGANGGTSAQCSFAIPVTPPTGGGTPSTPSTPSSPTTPSAPSGEGSAPSTPTGGGTPSINSPSVGGGTPAQVISVSIPTPISNLLSPSSILLPSYSFTRHLTVGSTGNDVKVLQQTLNSLGYTISSTGPGSSGNETTYYGPATTLAIQKFQCAILRICSGSPTTNGYGNFGPATRAAMSQRTGGTSVTPTSVTPVTPVTTTSSSFTRSLKLGMTGTDVKALQVFLNTKGFIVSATGAGSPGFETNYFGPATARAVSAFQEAYTSLILTPNGLTRGTGYFGVSTMRKANGLLGR